MPWNFPVFSVGEHGQLFVFIDEKWYHSYELRKNMNRFDPLHPSQSAIIEILSKKPGIKINTLHEMMEKDYDISISIQNLYRTVAQLADALVVFRDKGKLSLHMSWLDGLISLVETAKIHYQWDIDGIMDIPREEGKVVKYRANSIFGLDAYWDHILLQVVSMTEDTTWYEYTSHSYHALAIPDLENAFYRNLADRGVDMRILIGSTSFLDTYAEKTSSSPFTSILTDKSPFPKDGYQLFICGDYVLESLIPDVVLEQLTRFFDTVTSIDAFDVDLFRSAFRTRAECKISVRKSAEEAKKLREKFLPFFT